MFIQNQAIKDTKDYLEGECARVLQKVMACKTEHRIGQYFGKCLEIERALDQCLRDLKESKRLLSKERSKAMRKRIWGDEEIDESQPSK